MADSLPDRFGNALIDLWLQQRGRSAIDFTPVERLCYIGTRGMGALEFKPALTHESTTAVPLEVAELTALAGRAHFMTKRFDRDPTGNKIHVQSLCALGHYDFNMPGAYSYEQAFALIQKLSIGHDALREMFRRMAFNLIARNQDEPYT